MVCRKSWSLECHFYCIYVLMVEAALYKGFEHMKDNLLAGDTAIAGCCIFLVVSWLGWCHPYTRGFVLLKQTLCWGVSLTCAILSAVPDLTRSYCSLYVPGVTVVCYCVLHLCAICCYVCNILHTGCYSCAVSYVLSCEISGVKQPVPWLCVPIAICFFFYCHECHLSF